MTLLIFIAIAILIYYFFIYREDFSTPQYSGHGKKCPVCQNPVEENFNVCPICKETLKKKCPHCSERVDVSWRFCPYCGEILRKSDSQ